MWSSVQGMEAPGLGVGERQHVGSVRVPREEPEEIGHSPGPIRLQGVAVNAAITALKRKIGEVRSPTRESLTGRARGILPQGPFVRAAFRGNQVEEGSPDGGTAASVEPESVPSTSMNAPFPRKPPATGARCVQ